MRVGLDPFWIALAVVLPLPAAIAAAWPFWAARVKDEIGSVVGSAVILAAAVGFIAREYGDVLRITARCVEANVGCRFTPEPFMRYAIYAGIGLTQMFMLFVVGLLVEERRRDRVEKTRRKRTSSS